eukprot:TRINITY_DN3557_c0_g2_i5.p1 TRINITY_DN3557_c0_g2~~TRINITY_DN3557_c0_g2_i5.p1  ORF type:complete len:370 (+),score=89.69 TRINITY_DN3557_c0_g2_i5:65-1174(+)
MCIRDRPIDEYPTRQEMPLEKKDVTSSWNFFMSEQSTGLEVVFISEEFQAKLDALAPKVDVGPPLKEFAVVQPHIFLPKRETASPMIEKSPDFIRVRERTPPLGEAPTPTANARPSEFLIAADSPTIERKDKQNYHSAGAPTTRTEARANVENRNPNRTLKSLVGLDSGEKISARCRFSQFVSIHDIRDYFGEKNTTCEDVIEHVFGKTKEARIDEAYFVSRMKELFVKLKETDAKWISEVNERIFTICDTDFDKFLDVNDLGNGIRLFCSQKRETSLQLQLFRLVDPSAKGFFTSRDLEIFLYRVGQFNQTSGNGLPANFIFSASEMIEEINGNQKDMVTYWEFFRWSDSFNFKRLSRFCEPYCKNQV